MKAQLCLALLLTSGFSAMAQNRIPNPSFEIYNTDCTAGGMTTYNVWGWTRPQCALTGPYYNVCFEPPTYFESSVPTNSTGHAYPVEGDAYIAAVTFGEGFFGELINPRVFHTVALWEPLEANETYCIRLWASLMDNSSYKTSDLHCMLGVDTPNACLVSSLQWADEAQVILNTSEVDTAGWTQLEGTFVATGGESTLTIGDFHLGDYMDTVRIAFGLSPVYAGYYIDQVYLGPCDNTVEETSPALGISLYPNPATTTLDVRFTEYVANGSFEIIDVQGKVQFAHRVSGNRAKVDIQRLVDGMYYLQLKDLSKVYRQSFAVTR